jgi:hypothetical protein
MNGQTTADGDRGGERSDRSPEERLLDELIFRQDLNEVHLLIDFVSGRADRSLSTLTMPDPDDAKKILTSGEIVEAITTMRYPPGKSSALNGRNAAILLLAKDRLSALAFPARGLTIAYTAMVIDPEARHSIWSRLRRWLRGRGTSTTDSERRPSQHPGGDSGSSPGLGADTEERTHSDDTRINLAVSTFPALQEHVLRFGDWRRAMGWLALIAVALTALTYWDVALGRSVLERLDQNWKTRNELHRDNPELVRLRCESTDPDDAAELIDATKDKDGDNADRLAGACRRLARLSQYRTTERAELRRIFGCAGMSYTIPLHVWCWHWIVPGSAARPAEKGSDRHAVDARATAPANSAAMMASASEGRPPADIEWQVATSILTLFTSYILPMMFALLGTLIGAFRAILNKIGDSELAPRDLVRMILGIPAGLVAGIAVGLFLSPSSVPIEGTGGVAGQLTLTAGGLGFLAGYASQSFFNYLDNVVGTVFPSGTPSNSPPARAPAGNPR